MTSDYYHGLLVEPDCAGCPLRFRKKVLPDGPIPADIAIVGEAPGSAETREGKGFVGASGKTIWDTFAGPNGIRRGSCWVTNAALCQKGSVRLENGQVIQEEDVVRIATEKCRARLFRELEIVAPKVIIAVGAWALRSLSGIEKASIDAYRGSRLDVDLSKYSKEGGK